MTSDTAPSCSSLINVEYVAESSNSPEPMRSICRTW